MLILNNTAACTDVTTSCPSYYYQAFMPDSFQTGVYKCLCETTLAGMPIAGMPIKPLTSCECNPLVAMSSAL